MENSKSIKSNTGYKGVFFRKDMGKFVARLINNHTGNNKIDIHIGIYETLKEAVKAREDFIKSLF